MHYLRSGEKVKGLKAALGENTAGVGGYLVPDDFFAGIIEKRNELSIPRRAGAMILQTNRDVIQIPVESTSQTYFAQSAHDMAAVDEDEPTFSSAEAKVFDFTKIVQVSQNLLDDDGTNLNQFLTNSFGRWMAMTENRNALIGAGTTAPQGVTVGGTAALTFDATNAIAAAEIPELYHKLKQEYRDNAVWTLNDDTLGMLRGLSSSSVFTFGAHEINEESIMGKRAFTSTYMPKYTTKKYKAIVFGDWSMYALVERKGLVIQRLNEVYAANRKVGLLAWFRHGGVVLQSEAFAIGAMA
jgi:HK97 family phage major capsid protein